jgi:hypothetical protein
MARIVNTVLVGDERADEAAELQQRVPVAAVMAEPCFAWTRASRDASIDTTTPTRPSQMAASSFSKPGRAIPPPERPRSSSMMATSLQPSCRARLR